MKSLKEECFCFLDKYVDIRIDKNGNTVYILLDDNPSPNLELSDYEVFDLLADFYLQETDMEDLGIGVIGPLLDEWTESKIGN